MKKININKGFVLLMATAFLVGGFFVSSNVAHAADLNVPSEYSTIQEAIDAATVGDTINITEGTYEFSAQLNISKPLSIMGQGNVIFLAANSAWSTTNGYKHLLGIYSGTVESPVNVSNITVDCNSQCYGVNTYSNAYGILNNVTIQNSKGAGLTVNGSTITANNLSTHDNAWGAVNVDPGFGVTDPSVFTLNSGDLAENTQIWSDGGYVTDTVTVTVNADGYYPYKKGGTTAFLVWTNRALSGVATISKEGVTSFYLTIQSALDDAASGDTINVMAGTYSESLTINNPVILQSGAGAGSTTISGTSTVITVNSDDVSIVGFTITNGNTSGMGIYSADHSNLTITNNTITNIGNSNDDILGRGVVIVSSASLVNNINISNNQINNITSGLRTAGNPSVSSSGISIGWSNGTEDITNLVINANTISNINADTSPWSTTKGQGANGIVINHASGKNGNTGRTVAPQITNNTISNLEGLWAHAIGLEGNTPDAVVTGNTISGIIDHKDGTDDVGVFFQDNSSGATVTISGNKFNGGDFLGVAIHADDVSSYVYEVNASNNYWGSINPDFTSIVSDNVNYSPWCENEACSATRSFNVSINSAETGFLTIGEAIIAAEANDTINIKSGTYTTTGQILIDKNLTITNADGKPVIQLGADLPQNNNATSAWFLVNPDTNFTISNVILDGNGYKVHQGIRSHGTTTIQNVDFMDIRNNASPYVGFAVANFGGTVPGGAGSDTHSGIDELMKPSAHLIVIDSTFANIGRIGVLIKGTGSTATLTNNTYTGKGDGTFLDYAFEFGAGGSGTVDGGNVSNNRGVASDTSTSAGILVTDYYGTGTSATIENVNITNNTDGIAIGYDENDASTVVAHNNKFSGNTKAINSTNPAVDAENNWWGTSYSVGVADLVHGAVDFDPYYLTVAMTETNADLATAKTTAHDVLNTALATYTEANYTEANWITLNTFKTNGDTAINAAESVSAVTSAKNTATSGMAGVLKTTQVAPSGSGEATIDSGTPEVVITNPTQPVTLTISSGTTNPTIDVSAFITGGTGTLPAITTTSANAGNTTMAISTSTTVTSTDNTWNGVIAAPTTTTVALPQAPGTNNTLSTAIEVGFTGAKLSFDKAVRLLLPGQAGKSVGYIRTGIEFTEITATCSADTQDAGNTLVADGDCKIDVGSDLAIWTKHFTSFATYTTTHYATGGGGGTNRPYVSPATPATPATPAIPGESPATPATPATPAQVQGQVLGAEAFNFSATVRNGSRGADVLELQKLLSNLGYDLGTADGKFGAKTKAAVIKFQTDNGLKGDGVVGANTRAVLNNGQANGKALNTEAFNFSATVRNGSRGADVLELQKLLSNLGYDLGTADGKFGAKTKAAVIKFQTDNGLKGDGVVGANTRAVLNK